MSDSTAQATCLPCPRSHSLPLHNTLDVALRGLLLHISVLGPDALQRHLHHQNLSAERRRALRAHSTAMEFLGQDEGSMGSATSATTMTAKGSGIGSTRTSGITFMTLPTEIHLLISTYLPYPDALALKHTSRHFYSLVYTGVHLKVDWLVARFERKLECPMEQCSFRTDESFCNWRIRRIMRRRRRHMECLRKKGGCLVVEGRTCQTDLVHGWWWWWEMSESARGRKVLKYWGNEGSSLAIVIVLFSVVSFFYGCILTSASPGYRSVVPGVESGMASCEEVHAQLSNEWMEDF